MRRQPQARATKQQARINRFHDLKKDLSHQATETDLEMSLKLVGSVRKSLNFKMSTSPYDQGPMLQQFNLLVQNKDRLVLGDNGVGNQPCSIWLQDLYNQLLGKSSLVKRYASLTSSQQIEGLDESKRMINYLQEVAEEVKT